ncbi:hypothetical protein [Demequina litorisediminis]|uniref:Peptidase propeptide and YPEB domain protein n=1 Tax=Demequina litorisediminis TaxID=1849022 RepID=A0ABQ6IJK5_9MICO|nr:hypothetical protein [Demequina litorisediminis]GMA37291.1 hypothetical protein GCM10025876_34950 [Demequina litorisediminis]
MKIRSISTRIAAVAMGAALAVGVAIPASADTSAKVDKGEYTKVVVGKWTLAQVQKEFDSAGTNVSTSSTSRSVKWKTTTRLERFGVRLLCQEVGQVDRVVEVGLVGRRREADLGQVHAVRVRQGRLGSTLASVQKTAGTAGVVTSEYKSAYTESRTVEWPVPGYKYGWVQVDFTKKSGQWKTNIKAASWANGPKQTSNKMTKTEFDKIKVDKTTLDQARTIAGTSGTLTYEFVGSTVKSRTYYWPVSSRYGFAYVSFDGDTGKWIADYKNYYAG